MRAVLIERIFKDKDFLLLLPDFSLQKFDSLMLSVNLIYKHSDHQVLLVKVKVFAHGSVLINLLLEKVGDFLLAIAVLVE